MIQIETIAYENAKGILRKATERERNGRIDMKTIEERATEFALKEIRCKSVDELEHLGTEIAKKAFEEIRNDYIRIATEQKELDDKRIAELEKEKASLVLEVHNKNKRMAELKAEVYEAKNIDNPWQWIVDWVFENAPHEIFDELMSSRENYIKSMED